MVENSSVSSGERELGRTVMTDLGRYAMYRATVCPGTDASRSSNTCSTCSSPQASFTFGKLHVA